MKFLVVDDSATMRRIITTSLEQIGYTDFVEASNGFEALAKFSESIQFVITDWSMPVMSGIELIRKLRARPDGKTVPVLMVTTNNTKEDVVVAAQAGANGFLVKPISLQGLKEKIEAILNPREPC
mgnify:FL=1